MEKNLLISVIVVTYNFEKIILETLESVKKQEYKKIELIITDDNSKDETINIVKKWAMENRNRFIEIKIIENKINNGVTKNINIGVKEAKGNWIKILAGDDILRKDAFINFVNFLEISLEAEIIFSKVIPFKDKEDKREYGKEMPNLKQEKFFKKTIKRQLFQILDDNVIPAPGAFFKRELLERMEYFDERFRMVEDHPFWIKLLKNNVNFFYMPIVTVEYRKLEDSVSGKKNNEKISLEMYKYDQVFYEQIYKKEMKNKIKKWNWNIRNLRKNLIIRNGNKTNFFIELIRYLELRRIIRVLVIILFILFFIKIIK